MVETSVWRILMLHLFKKVYLDLDANIDSVVDRIVISADTGYPLLEDLKKVQIGQLLEFGLDIDDLVGVEKRWETIESMLQYCFDQDKKIFIYCDKATLMKLSAYWFKTIFVNIDGESAYRIIKSAFVKAVLFELKDRVKTQPLYKQNMPTEEEFLAVFAETEVDQTAVSSLVSNMQTTKSYEYLLASYFYNGSNEEELKAIHQVMITRYVDAMLRDAWRGLQRNFLRPEYQTALGLQLYTIDNAFDLVNDPVVAVLKDLCANLLPEELPPSSLTYADLTEAQITELKTLMINILGYPNNQDETNPLLVRPYLYMSKLSNLPLSKQDLDDLLALELTPPDDVSFWMLKDTGNINFYLINYFIEVKKSEQLGLLEPFLLK